MEAPKGGYLSGLFDFSFSELITKKIIRFLYLILVIAIGLVAVVIIISGFMRGFFAGLIAIVIAGLVFLVYVTLIRVGLEVYIVIFRIADYTKEIAEHNRYGGSSPGSAPPSGVPPGSMPPMG